MDYSAPMVTLLVTVSIFMYTLLSLIPGSLYNRVIEYCLLRNLGLRHDRSWEMARMQEVIERLVASFVGLLLMIGVLTLISPLGSFR